MTTTQVATIERQPRSVLVDMSTRYGMEPAAFEATLRATVCKTASKEEFAAFLLVAKEYGLNPLTKELYAFPAKGGGIQPIVSIDGWARIINDHPGFDGMEFEDVREGAELIAITCRMFRKDRSHPIEATEYMAECKRTTDVWRTWPRRMLRHKALIQCARYAFGFSGIVDQDEYERQVEQVRQAPPVGLTARLQAANVAGEGFNAAQAEEPAHDPETGEIADAEFTDPPADDGLPIRDDAAEDFPGDAPTDEPKPDLPPMKTGADLLAEKDAAPKSSLAERVAKFKASCAGAGTTKLMDAWRKSSVLRSDLDASDPEEVAALTDWWQASFDAAETAEKGG
jgi:phage recombination protein Bet